MTQKTKMRINESIYKVSGFRLKAGMTIKTVPYLVVARRDRSRPRTGAGACPAMGRHPAFPKPGRNCPQMPSYPNAPTAVSCARRRKATFPAPDEVDANGVEVSHGAMRGAGMKTAIASSSGGIDSRLPVDGAFGGRCGFPCFGKIRFLRRFSVPRTLSGIESPASFGFGRRGERSGAEGGRSELEMKIIQFVAKYDKFTMFFGKFLQNRSIVNDCN